MLLPAVMLAMLAMKVKVLLLLIKHQKLQVYGRVKV
jgi:hypothetical protein